MNVTVVTALPYYPQWEIYPEYKGMLYRTEQHGEVLVKRAWHYSRSHPGAIGRIMHEASLGAFALPRILNALNQADVAIIVSPDLSLAFVAARAARALDVPYVLSVQDVMPDAAIELGMLADGAPARLARHFARSIYSSAQRIYTLSEGMRSRIDALSGVGEKTHIVPNTIDTREFELGADGGRPFREEFVSPGTFAVVHSGNMGEKQDLDVLLRAARSLLPENDVHFYVFGDGAVRGRFEQRCREWSLSNVSLKPFQSRELLPHMLRGADAVLVSQRAEVVDIVVPSKLVTAMAAGAMIVAACADDSDTARILRASGGGVIVPAGDAEALVTALRAIKAGHIDERRHRERVREYAVQHFQREKAYAPVVDFLMRYAPTTTRSL